jgi:DNA-directed RNA polymerase subunit RPC12/RpoP
MKDGKMATYVFKCKLCGKEFPISCPLDAVIGSEFYCPECGGESKIKDLPIVSMFKHKTNKK